MFVALERKIKSPKSGWIREGSPQTSSPPYFHGWGITDRKYPPWASRTAQIRDDRSLGTYTQARLATQYKLNFLSRSFRNIIWKGGGGKQMLILLCVCTISICKEEVIQKQAHVSVTFTALPCERRAKINLKTITPKVQPFEMPWLDQFQDWCFPVSIPRTFFFFFLNKHLNKNCDSVYNVCHDYTRCRWQPNRIGLGQRQKGLQIVGLKK